MQTPEKMVCGQQKNIAGGGKIVFLLKGGFFVAVKIVWGLQFPTNAFRNSFCFVRFGAIFALKLPFWCKYWSKFNAKQRNDAPWWQVKPLFNNVLFLALPSLYFPDYLQMSFKPLHPLCLFKNSTLFLQHVFCPEYLAQGGFLTNTCQ